MASSWSSWSLWIEQSATRCHNLLLYYMYDVPTTYITTYLLYSPTATTAETPTTMDDMRPCTFIHPSIHID